jgi:hypothetical protein
MTFYRLTARGHLPQGEIFNFTLHAENISGTLSGAGAAWHTALGLLWNGVATPADSIKQCVPSSIGIDASVVDALDALTGKNDAQLVTTETLVGTNATDPLVNQDAVVVSLRTAKATKAGRGRFFLPPFGEDQTTAGLLLATPRGQVATAAQKMVQSLNGAGYIVKVFHRHTITADAVTSVDVSNVVGTQRRRRNKIVPVRSSLTV